MALNFQKQNPNPATGFSDPQICHLLMEELQTNPDDAREFTTRQIAEMIFAPDQLNHTAIAQVARVVRDLERDAKLHVEKRCIPVGNSTRWCLFFRMPREGEKPKSLAKPAEKPKAAAKAANKVESIADALFREATKHRLHELRAVSGYLSETASRGQQQSDRKAANDLIEQFQEKNFLTGRQLDFVWVLIRRGEKWRDAKLQKPVEPAKTFTQAEVEAIASKAAAEAVAAALGKKAS